MSEICKNTEIGHVEYDINSTVNNVKMLAEHICQRKERIPTYKKLEGTRG